MLPAEGAWYVGPLNDGAGAEIFGDKGPDDLGLLRDGDRGAVTLEKGLGPVKLLLTCITKPVIRYTMKQRKR